MRKFSCLFLLLSLLALSGNMYAKEKRGVDMIVQKKDGQQVRGELIAVKENSLLLLERESGADVTVVIVDIRVITIVKKWKAGKGFLYGSIVGGVGVMGFDALVVAGLTASGMDIAWGNLALFSLGVVAGTGILGAIISGLSSFDKTIQIEGKSDVQNQEILEELRKKARVKNYK